MDTIVLPGNQSSDTRPAQLYDGDATDIFLGSQQYKKSIEYAYEHIIMQCISKTHSYLAITSSTFNTFWPCNYLVYSC